MFLKKQTQRLTLILVVPDTSIPRINPIKNRSISTQYLNVKTVYTLSSVLNFGTTLPRDFDYGLQSTTLLSAVQGPT